MKELKHLQQWLQGVIVHPNGVQHGAQSTSIEGETWNIDSVIAPSPTLTSQQRVEIYQGGYFARLINCFRSEYQGLLNAMGTELFEHLTWSFLQQHPSTSYTLNDLGDLFPSFLESTLLESMEGQEPESWQLFIIDIAKYERLYNKTFNASGHEKLLSDDFLNETKVKLSPSLSCLSLQFEIADCIGDFRENEATEFPDLSPTNYVFARQRFRVKTHALETKEWNALQHWIENPEQDCPQEYREIWQMKGIAYA